MINEIESRLSDSTWNDQIAGRILKVKRKRRQRAYLISGSLSCIFVFGVTLMFVLPGTGETAPFLNTQVSGTIAQVYGSTETSLYDSGSSTSLEDYSSRETTDSIILNTLALR
jgi:hypothetical protein